jgi:hypothetical protein
VSTLVHANKTDEESREGGSEPLDPTVLSESRGSQSVKIPWFIPESRKACVCPEEIMYILSRVVSLCLFLANPGVHFLNQNPVTRVEESLVVWENLS